MGLESWKVLSQASYSLLHNVCEIISGNIVPLYSKDSRSTGCRNIHTLCTQVIYKYKMYVYEMKIP